MGNVISSCFHDSITAGNAKFIDARYSTSTSESSRSKFRRSLTQFIDSDPKHEDNRSELRETNRSLSTVAEVVDTKNLEMIFDTMQNEERFMCDSYYLDGTRSSDSFNEWMF